MYPHAASRAEAVIRAARRRLLVQALVAMWNPQQPAQALEGEGGEEMKSDYAWD